MRHLERRKGASAPGRLLMMTNAVALMAAAADRTIVQVTRLVEPGGIDPEAVITPGIFVDAVFEVPDPQQEEELIRAGAHHP